MPNPQTMSTKDRQGGQLMTHEPMRDRLAGADEALYYLIGDPQ